jgi:hypothetical protein
LKLNYLNRIPSQEHEEFLNDEIFKNQEKFEDINQNGSDNDENNSKRQFQMNNLRDYVKNVLVEHMNTNQMRDFVDDLRKDYQSRNIKSASKKTIKK